MDLPEPDTLKRGTVLRAPQRDVVNAGWAPGVYTIVDIFKTNHGTVDRGR